MTKRDAEPPVRTDGTKPGSDDRNAPAGLVDVRARVAAIWAAVLGGNPGPTDDFFQIGGHSLTAARVIGMVRKSFQIALPFDVIFDSPVLADFAMQVAQRIQTEET